MGPSIQFFQKNFNLWGGEPLLSRHHMIAIRQTRLVYKCLWWWPLDVELNITIFTQQGVNLWIFVRCVYFLKLLFSLLFCFFSVSEKVIWLVCWLYISFFGFVAPVFKGHTCKIILWVRFMIQKSAYRDPFPSFHLKSNMATTGIQGFFIFLDAKFKLLSPTLNGLFSCVMHCDCGLWCL